MGDESAREFILNAFNAYDARKQNNNLYNMDDFVPQNLIRMYLEYVDKLDFGQILTNYKKRYIYNESKVEPNSTVEEKKGLSEVYNYIQKFDFNKDYFNIFTCSLLIHQKLYSKCFDPSFGGTLRKEQALLNDTMVDVMTPKEASDFLNSFICPSKELIEKLNTDDTFEYINECVRISTELIKAQPFADGNKRTFRALLNLMLKRKHLPPVYISTKERTIYKEALNTAMIKGDYSLLNRFYYYKICDAIVSLDIEHEKQVEDEKGKSK